MNKDDGPSADPCIADLTIDELLVRGPLPALLRKRFEEAAYGGDEQAFRRRMEAPLVLSQPPPTRAFAYVQGSMAGGDLFAAAVEPLVRGSVQAVREDALRGGLSGRALQHLGRALSWTLQAVLRDVVATEFLAYRGARETGLESLLRVSRGESSTRIRDAFLAYLQEDRLEGLCNRHPMLARHLSCATSLWQHQLRLLLRRLGDDREKLDEHFGASAGVTEVSPGLSDRHNGGQSVMILGFGSGTKVVYKPRGLHIDRVWNRFLARLNCFQDMEQRTLRCIDGGEYGWAQFVPHAPLPPGVEAGEFHRRSGALLCLAWVLDATDLHYENVIASGAFPVLLDVETLFHPRHVVDIGVATASTAAYQVYYDSVLRTGLLPSWSVDEDGATVDTSGFGAFGEQRALCRQGQWRDTQGDDLRFETKARVRLRSHNIPRDADGVPAPLTDYASEFVAGFETQYGFLMTHKGLVTELLEEFRGCKVRVVVRDTASYKKSIEEMLTTQGLSSALHTSVALERLAVPYWTSPQARSIRPILPFEREALLRLDIPYFWTQNTSRSLPFGEDQEVENCFEEPSFDRVVSRLANLNEDCLAKQIEFIQASIAAREAVPHGSPKQPGVPSNDAHAEAPTPLQEAVRIGDILRNHSIEGPAGGRTWIGLDFDAFNRRWRFQPIGDSLFSGAIGIALFFGALFRTTKDPKWREFCLEILHDSRELLQGGQPVEPQGLVYGLAVLSQWLHAPGLVQDAAHAALRLEPLATEDSDFLFGVAGQLCSLLALWRVEPEGRALSLARSCGDVLVERAEPVSGGLAWRDKSDRYLTGMSHGTTGIALALWRLADLTCSQDYRDTALGAVRYERGTFCSERKRWPDLRDSSRRAFMAAWCNGDTGIGMARLEMSELPERDFEIDCALQTTLQTPPRGLAHLCCGTMGRVEFLIRAAEVLRRPELLTQARDWARTVASQARRQAGYSLVAGLPEKVLSPGLFQGLAGVGYTFLRLADPVEVKSCQLMDSAHLAEVHRVPPRPTPATLRLPEND